MATTIHERALSVILFCQEDTEIQTQALRSLTEQTLSTEQFEILVPTTLAQSHDFTGPFDTRTYTTVNEAIGLATGRIILFVDSAYTLATTLLDTHLAMHRNRPEGKLCVMGGATPDTARHCNPLARYIDEDSLLNPYRGLLPLGLVEAKDVQLHNLSIPQQAFIKHGRFDTHFANHDIAIVDFCFRVHDAGYKILYANDAQTHYIQTPDLARIERTQHRLAKDWVSVFMKHPNRLREWGGLRHATRLQLETQADELAEHASERRNIIEQLAGFHFDTDPTNPVGNPETQQRILRTIDEQFTPLYRGWWSAGFAEGLYTHHLDGFEALLNQANRTDDLFARHHMMVIGDKLHPLEQQALYEWSSTADEHSLGGMVIATTATDEDQLDRIATQVASTVLRATPNATPASVHLVPCDATKEGLRPLFLATDRWIAQPSAQARTFVTTAHEEGCEVHWLPDRGVLHAPNLPGNLRIGLWPNWDGYTDLLALIDKWWPALSARQDCSIVLFHEKGKASRAKRSAQTLQELLDQSANGDHTAHVVTAEAPTTQRAQSYWRMHLDGVIQLPSGYGADRMNWLLDLGARPFFTPIELERHLVSLHLLTDKLLGHAPEVEAAVFYQEVHEQLS